MGLDEATQTEPVRRSVDAASADADSAIPPMGATAAGHPAAPAIALSAGPPRAAATWSSRLARIGGPAATRLRW